MSDSEFFGTFTKDGISRQAFSREDVYKFQFDGWQQQGDGQTELAPERPARNGTLEAWRTFASANGIDVEGKTRDDLAALFTS
jgi:hypothetical protein